MPNLNHEQQRLDESRRDNVPWKKWGPYLSERQWGTVREDYSDNGDAWNYFSHDQSRSRAYKWGEDGIAGISDDKQRVCWALALWNGKDPIIKERMFGLTNSEGNHGEDVKEYYFYLDSTPTHSYMKYLYKYPQRAYPYVDLIQTNRRRTRNEMEYELIDTGIFDDDRYFDVFIEFAKDVPEDILIKISVANRGPDTATLHVLPHLWFRNTWWMNPNPDLPRPALRAVDGPKDVRVIEASHPELGTRYLYAEGASELLFTENETNTEWLWRTPNATKYVKDGVNDYIVHGLHDKVNPNQTGTKSAAHYEISVGPGETKVIRMRLTDVPPSEGQQQGQRWFHEKYEQIFATRIKEADEFYTSISPPALNADQINVMRQALAGMLWTKQYYFFDLDLWLREHNANPAMGGTRQFRNRDWYHMVNDDVISMPDKWEYPWFAAWDLAFHTYALNMVDPDFAGSQLELMLSELYLHPNGQIPAYEWNFSDVNPPVHAYAALLNYSIAREPGQYDLTFLKTTFNKLVMNFNWWVNRKDPQGRNVFAGGFLGLDNIGVFDRSATLPTGGHIEQADGTAWMAFYCQCMFEMAIEIARKDPTYEDFVLKFLEHFLWIAGSMDRIGENEDELWDEEDGFFYDTLILPGGRGQRIKVRSMVGLLPLTATVIIPQEVVDEFPRIAARTRAFVNRHPELVANINPIGKPGVNGRRLLSVVNEDKLRRILARMLDENRFLSPYGIRSLSRSHLEHPYVFDLEGSEFRVNYLPAESDTGMFGGNSNWRGPIWMPVNLLLIRALAQFYMYYGDEFKIECPTGSRNFMTLAEVALEISRRLSRIFLKDADGRRPVYGGTKKFQTDPHWRDYVLFYEYFHGDNGAGLGASHQTGWTGTVARLIQQLGVLHTQELLAQGVHVMAEHYQREPVS
jgi:hypothetical protein